MSRRLNIRPAARRPRPPSKAGLPRRQEQCGAFEPAARLGLRGGQVCGGLYPVLVLCACFIAASASLAVSSVVVSKRANAPVEAADIEQAATCVLSGNSQIATPSYSPKAI